MRNLHRRFEGQWEQQQRGCGGRSTKLAVALLATACAPSDPVVHDKIAVAAAPTATSAEPTPKPTKRSKRKKSKQASTAAKSKPKGPGVNPFSGNGSRQEKVIYLTFDDGPWLPYTNEVLDILRTHRAKATFFVVGNMAQQNPTEIKRIAGEGHAIGNHTWDHKDLRKLKDEAIREQLTSTAEVVGKYRGPCMRPPYGGTNDRVRKVADEEGYATILWGKHVSDWDQPPPSVMVSRLKAATKHGLNVLLHDGGGPRGATVATIAEIIPYWQEQGYSLEPVPECLR